MYTGTLVEIFNMGSGEIMLILAVVLLLFGGKKLPELARGLGKGLRDFKDASEGVKREIHRNINSAGLTDEINEFKSVVNDADNSKHHPYDYQASTEDTPWSATDESNNNTAADPDTSEDTEHMERIAEVKHTDHNEHTKIETDKTKL